MVNAPHSLDSIVSSWAHHTPQAIAVIADDTSLSYRELEQQANQLARRLLRAGAAPGTGVGLLMARSAEFVIAVLAVLKVGAYYVPLSAELPAGRTQTMLHDNNIQIVRNLLFGGEVAAPILVSQAAGQWPDTRLIHCYGPTECSVFTTCHSVTIPHDQHVPLGKPIPGRYIGSSPRIFNPFHREQSANSVSAERVWRSAM